MTQLLITKIARMEPSPCARHGEIIQVQRAKGFAITSARAVTFADGTTLYYWLRAGIPTLLGAD